ncbi:ATP-dependent zinc metalloprotease FtsH [Candidatus Dojkabacteria bacterium]|nr:ATP-dependent zinc metalloprotease FtsH [Candidatus Dojkabacteria bacterium]
MLSEKEDNLSRSSSKKTPIKSRENVIPVGKTVIRVKRVDSSGNPLGDKGINKRGTIISIVVIVAILVLGFLYISFFSNPATQVSTSEVIQQIEDDNVKSITVKEDKVFVELKKDKGDGKNIFTYRESDTSFSDFLQKEGVTISETDIDFSTEPVTKVNWLDIVSVLFMAVVVIAVFMFVRNMQASGGKLLDFGESKAKLIFGKKTNVAFDDVAGIKESKDELIEIVEFLRNPKKYTRLGARIPKGVLLVGPPGSGKTLLAKAVAGEAGVPFFHTSGSEFEEMLVGAGASRVRDLFAKARRAAPCIIFVDEIDAVAKKRGTTLHSGNTEQTLNQLLVEMDGLEPSVNVIVMAATNRPDVLDPAILRPGRFDRNVVLSLPDAQEREEILKIHSVKKKLSEDIDLSKVARNTVGFSGADLENTLNEAAILAAKQDQKEIMQKDIDESALKVKYGPEKRSKRRREEDLKSTAYHEAGHAIVAYLTEGADPVYGVSIISRGMSGGMTMLMPEKDVENHTYSQLLARISVTTGGNVAEELVFNDVSTGASQDIKTATEIAKEMVKNFGMSKKLGFVQYGDLDEMQYLGYGYEQRDYSDVTAQEIDSEIKSIITESWNSAYKLLKENRNILDELASELLEKEDLNEADFKKFMDKYNVKKVSFKKSLENKAEK